MAAARAIAEIVTDEELREDYIIPSVFNRDVAPAVAAAVADRGAGERDGGGGRPRGRVRAGRHPMTGTASGAADGGRRGPVPAERGLTKVAITGATGLIGPGLIAALRERSDEVTVLSRDPEQAARNADRRCSRRIAGTRFQTRRPRRRSPGATRSCTSRARRSRNAGASAAKRAIRDSRARGHAQPRAGTARAGRARPPAGPGQLLGDRLLRRPHGHEPIDEEAPAGDDFLAQVCVDWEAQARAAVTELQMRAVQMRTGVVLDRAGGALAKMLPPVPPGYRRAGRRGAPVRGLDPPRGPGRDDARRA